MPYADIEDRKRKRAESYRINKSVENACSRRWYNENRDNDEYRRRKLLTGAKARAKKRRIPFDLTLDDIHIPEFCPVFGILLKVSRGRGADKNSPTLDRIDNKKGYTKGNVRVISFWANYLKSDMTIEQAECLLSYMKSSLAVLPVVAGLAF